MPHQSYPCTYFSEDAYVESFVIDVTFKNAFKGQVQVVVKAEIQPILETDKEQRTVKQKE